MMKTMKKAFILTGLAIVALLASCSKAVCPEEQSAGNQDLQLNITVAGIGDADTKAVKKSWSGGDRINIWFDGNDVRSFTPDLVIIYDGRAWFKDGNATMSGNVPSASGRLIALFEGGNDIGKWTDGTGGSHYPPRGLGAGNNSYAMPLAVKCTHISYTVARNVLSANLTGWSYLTPIQIVISGLDKNKASYYTLRSDGLYGSTALLSSNNNLYQTNSYYNHEVVGIPNKDGVAFYFQSNKSTVFNYTFTLSDYSGASVIERTFSKSFLFTISQSSTYLAGIQIPSTYFYRDGAIRGTYTVGEGPDRKFGTSDDVKVAFAKGNLVWDGSFKMHDHQYDYEGVWSDSKIDLFNWSKDANIARARSYSDGGRTISDTFFAANDGVFTGWDVLTADEWYYLISTRPNSLDNAFAVRKPGVTVCGVKNCLVLAPDDNKTEILSSYNASQWADAEAAGYVCLPPAGFRIGGTVSDEDNYGYYWSTTTVQNEIGSACYMKLWDSNCTAGPSQRRGRNVAMAVRLVMRFN